MNVNLTPFSIYWFLFLILNVIYFIFPFLFFLLLPAVFVMILIWGICVFEIGRATIISSQTKRITRVILAFLASLLTISINPIGMILWDFINWRHINSFADYFSKAYWIIFLIHMLLFCTVMVVAWNAPAPSLPDSTSSVNCALVMSPLVS